jgi:CHAD domain-containing protein
MARPIETNESVPHAIRRLARAGLRSALKRLAKGGAPLDEQVHEARTAIKKVRSLTRLVRPAVKRARRENRRLRAVARALSAVRDAHVRTRTLEDLTRGYAGAHDPSVQAVAAFLSEQLDEARRAFDRAKGRKHLERHLRKARRRIERWLPGKDRWPALGPGFLQGYRRGQKAMTSAYQSKSDLAFHAWRRAVKSHRHQVHALSRLFPEDLSGRLEELDQLDRLLGDEHDLSALKEAFKEIQPRVAWNQRCAGLLKLLNERRARLRSQARELGEPLFERSLKTFRSQIKAHLQKEA